MKNSNIKKSINPSKSRFKKSFLLMGLSTLLLTSLSASEKSSTFSLTANSNNTLLLQLPGNIDSPYTISIYDTEGLNVHQEELQGGTQARNYNLKKLPSGEYTFEISFHQTKKWKHIKIVDDTLQTITEDFHMIIEPTVVISGGYIDLNLLCFSDSKVNLSIWDKHGSLLFQDLLVADGAIEKRYNLKNLKAGDYQLYVSSTDPSIDFEFTKIVEITTQKRSNSDSEQIALNK